MARRKLTTHNLIVVSDLHCGCRLGLCPPEGAKLDDGGTYMPSKLQLKLWEHWLYFWKVVVPRWCKREPFALVVNGDSVDGVHHNSTTQVSHNLQDQKRIARLVLAPVIKRAKAYYHVRGTEAHVGKSGVNEEELAEELGAVPNADGQYARHELWYDINGHLVHTAHHIGTTGSQHYESSAVMRELVEAYVESGRWNDRTPQVVVRSHRHRYLEVRIPSERTFDISVVSPGWQLKTPFAYKIAGGRQAQPQIGGVLIRLGDEELYTRPCVWRIPRPKPEVAQ